MEGRKERRDGGVLSANVVMDCLLAVLLLWVFSFLSRLFYYFFSYVSPYCQAEGGNSPGLLVAPLYPYALAECRDGLVLMFRESGISYPSVVF